jgi:Holliday junction resolvasome RuvABC DNA-binding subunit
VAHGRVGDLPGGVEKPARRMASQMLEGLKKKERAGAGRPAKNNNCLRSAAAISEYAEALEEIGVSKQDASRWRSVAEVPELQLPGSHTRKPVFRRSNRDDLRQLWN